MYVGRFIVVAPDRAAYRVSSRSFPNRRVIEREGALTVAPTEDAPETDNPYISYNCLRTTEDGEHAVIGNGTQVDPITEKLELGYPARDALVESLLALDYEKDDYDTPRIAGVVGDESYIGIVRRDAVIVEAVEEPTLVATYEAERAGIGRTRSDRTRGDGARAVRVRVRTPGLCGGGRGRGVGIRNRIL